MEGTEVRRRVTDHVVRRQSPRRRRRTAVPSTVVRSPTRTSCTVTGLTNGVSYSFKIVANNDFGKGKPATTAVVIPTADSIPATVPRRADERDGRARRRSPCRQRHGDRVVDRAECQRLAHRLVHRPLRRDNTFGCMTTGTTCFIAGLTGGESIAIRVVRQPTTSEMVPPRLTCPPPRSRSRGHREPQRRSPASRAPSCRGRRRSPTAVQRSRRTTSGSSTKRRSPLVLTGCSVTDAKSCIVNGLTNGVAYSFAIVAHTTVGDSKPATTGVVTPTGVPIPATAPAAPTERDSRGR